MSTAPRWATGELPPIGEEAKQRLAADVRAERLKVGGLRGVSADRDRARLELTEEQRALRSTFPPNTRRWRQLAKHDEAVAAAQVKLDGARTAAQEAEQALQRAPQEDAEALARWLEGGEKGPRPTSAVYELERERNAAQLLVEAAQRVLDDALERRLRHVEKHREKMLRDAREDVESALATIRDHVALLPQLRARLIEARETLAWAACFPGPIASFGSTSAVALGLKAPVEATLGTGVQLAFERLLAALEADADALAHRFAPPVAEKLGAGVQATPLTEAMWSSDERAREWGRQEIERARRLAEWTDPETLGSEVREIRPE